MPDSSIHDIRAEFLHATNTFRALGDKVARSTCRCKPALRGTTTSKLADLGAESTQQSFQE